MAASEAASPHPWRQKTESGARVQPLPGLQPAGSPSRAGPLAASSPQLRAQRAARSRPAAPAAITWCSLTPGLSRCKEGWEGSSSFPAPAGRKGASQPRPPTHATAPSRQLCQPGAALPPAQLPPSPAPPRPVAPLPKPSGWTRSPWTSATGFRISVPAPRRDMPAATRALASSVSGAHPPCWNLPSVPFRFLVCLLEEADLWGQ